MKKPATQQAMPWVEIGKYTISPWTDTHVMIQCEDGDAGEFEIKKLEKVIHDFFEREF